MTQVTNSTFGDYPSTFASLLLASNNPEIAITLLLAHLLLRPLLRHLAPATRLINARTTRARALRRRGRVYEPFISQPLTADELLCKVA